MPARAIPFSLWACYLGLMDAKADDQYSDEETERRMRDALRRALTTPPKPQKAMVGKAAKSKPIKKGEKPT